MTNPPVRAYRLTLKLEADSREELALALFNLSTRVDRDELSTGITGGPSSGAIYELLCDPNQTHEHYFAEVHQHLSNTKEAV